MHNQAGQAMQDERADPQSLAGPDPLVRVRLANAGDRMTHQLKAARQIADAARDDPTIVGVVGLGRNQEDSARTLATLWAAGLPVVATSNSSDELAGSSPYYFHIAPTNQQEVQVAVDYLATRQIGAGVVFEDVREPYGRELAKDFNRTARRIIKGIRLSSITYGERETTPRDDLPAKAKAACDAANGDLELIYYAGRSEDLPSLFSGLAQSRCKSQEHPVTVLSGDDLTRYTQPPPGLADLYYTTLTYPPVWECMAAPSIVPEMFAQYERAFQAGHPSGFKDPNLIGGHALLGFDATSAIAQAATAAHQGLRDARHTAPPQVRYATVTANAVLHELGRTSFNGATGWVDLRTQWKGGAAARKGAIWEKAVVLVHITADGARTMERLDGPLVDTSRDGVKLRTNPPCPLRRSSAR
jgi:ABC-type branched-subunit amino acid transport system substrate-binding protein